MNDKLQSLRGTAEYAEEKLVARAQSLLEGILQEKGMSKTDLAKKMGVSKARVSQIFSDNQNFTFRLMAKAFYALGEELSLCREAERVEHKSLPAHYANCEVSFKDKTREISHGFEWLDFPLHQGGQSIHGNVLSKSDVAGLLEDALHSIIQQSGESMISRHARERDHDRATTLDWSQTNAGSNVIPMVRKRAAGNG